MKKGIILCLIATMSWGGMFLVTGEILKVMDPFYMTLFRYIPAGILFLIILLIIEKANPLKNINKKDLFMLWGLGTLGFCGFSFLVFLGQSLSKNGSIIASIMMGIQPLIAVIIGKYLRGGKVKNFSIYMMFLALIGVIFVVTNGKISSLFISENIIPVVLIFLGATSWVIYSTGVTFFEYSPIKYTALTNLLGGLSIIFIVSIMTILGYLDLPSVRTVYTLMPNFLYLIFIAGALAVLSWNNGNKLLGPINASLFMSVVPITTFSLSVIFLERTISIYEFIGLILVISALIGNNTAIRKKL
ncbi:MAG: DMT family transporter [Mycoplasmatales bacterium]